MRRLYLQVYFTIVASLFLVVITAGAVWHFSAGVLPFEQPFEAAGEVIAELVPPPNAPDAVQQQAIKRLAQRLGADLALFGRTNDRSPPPLPLRRRTGMPELAAHRCRRVSIRRRWALAGGAPAFSQRRAARLAALLARSRLSVGAPPLVAPPGPDGSSACSAASSLGAGDLRAASVEGRDEVARLAQASTRRRPHRAWSGRQMLLNASHELRTLAHPARPRAGGSGPRLQGRAYARHRRASTRSSRNPSGQPPRCREGLDARDEIDLAALAAEECARHEGCSVQGQAVTVRGDSTLLRRMIRNLVENAQLHGKPPVEVTVERRGADAVLSVSDRGAVIAPDARERLFSAFYRIPGRSGPRDTGLGLALVRQIARRHGGDAAYCPERGSCFTVTLRAA